MKLADITATPNFGSEQHKVPSLSRKVYSATRREPALYADDEAYH